MKNLRQKEFNSDDLKIKEYLSKYIQELQRHFGVSDRKIRRILLAICKDLTPLKYIKIFVNKLFNMVESSYIKQNKRYYDGN